MEAARERIAPVAERLVLRARESGRLRPDFDSRDLAMLQLMISTVGAATVDAAPQVWRRYLILLLDGMIAARDEPTAQTEPALTAGALAQVFRGNFSRGRPPGAGQHPAPSA